MSAERSARLKEVLAFLVVGGVSAGIDAAIFLILVALGVVPPLASAIGFLTSFMFNFFGNQRLVFRARHEGWQLVRYISLVVVNLGLSAGIVAAGVAVGLPPLAAKVISLVVIATFNYFALRRWVFRSTRENPRGSEGDASAAS